MADSHGNACLTPADALIVNNPNCVNAGTNSTIQTNLAAQIAKYKNDLNIPGLPHHLRGIGYNFSIR